MEYELLKFLATHPGKVFTREMLLSRVWGYEYYGGARTVDVHIRRLRAKLSEEHAALIQTVRSVGYRFGQSRWRSEPFGCKPVRQPSSRLGCRAPPQAASPSCWSVDGESAGRRRRRARSWRSRSTDG